MINEHYDHNPTHVFPAQTATPDEQRPPMSGVRQDKGAEKCARITSNQPAPLETGLRAQTKDDTSERSQKKTVHKRQTIHTTLYLKPRIRSELERVAQRQQISVSAAGSSLLEWALTQTIVQEQAVTGKCPTK